jgi:hypothetical protein
MTEIGVDRKPFARQLAGLSPPPAGRVPFLSPILPTAEDRHADLFAPLTEAVLDYSPQLLREVVAWHENGGLGRNPCLIEVANR